MRGRFNLSRDAVFYGRNKPRFISELRRDFIQQGSRCRLTVRSRNTNDTELARRESVPYCSYHCEKIMIIRLKCCKKRLWYESLNRFKDFFHACYSSLSCVESQA